MKKKIFLHVGLHKTGTTSIQCSLTFSRELLSQHGILYPKSGVPAEHPFGQHKLAWASMSNDLYIPKNYSSRDESGKRLIDDVWSELHSEIEGSEASSIVISSEEFDTLSTEEINMIGVKLQNYDIFPVLYIRNKSDFLDSSFKTSIMYAHYDQTAEFFVENQRSRIDFAAMIADWDAISCNGVVLRNFDVDETRNNIVLSFLEILDIDPKLFGDQSNRHDNKSESAALLFLAHYMRRERIGEDNIEKWIRVVKPLIKKPLRASLLSQQLLDQFDKSYNVDAAKITEYLRSKNAAKFEWPIIDRSYQPRIITTVGEALIAIAHELAGEES